MRVEFISKGEKKNILKILKETYGIDYLNFLIFKSGKKKLRIFSGNLSREELMKVVRTFNTESLGLDFGVLDFEDGNEEVRLKLDSAHLLSNNIKKNILELEDIEAEKFSKGEDIEKISGKKGFVILRNKEDIIGTGKATKNKILNFLPKERRAR